MRVRGQQKRGLASPWTFGHKALSQDGMPSMKAGGMSTGRPRPLGQRSRLLEECMHETARPTPPPRSAAHVQKHAHHTTHVCAHATCMHTCVTSAHRHPHTALHTARTPGFLGCRAIRTDWWVLCPGRRGLAFLAPTQEEKGVGGPQG